MAWLVELSVGTWLILAAVLLLIEIVLGVGFFIGLAIASALMAIISFFEPHMSWQLQLGIFAISSIIATIAYWQVFKKFNNTTDQPLLNNRMEQLIGRRWLLSDDVVTGEGVQQIGDTVWKVKSQQRLSAGELVEVYGVEGSLLLIRPVKSE